jgi:hypothetical protein
MKSDAHTSVTTPPRDIVMPTATISTASIAIKTTFTCKRRALKFSTQSTAMTYSSTQAA